MAPAWSGARPQRKGSECWRWRRSIPGWLSKSYSKVSRLKPQRVGQPAGRRPTASGSAATARRPDAARREIVNPVLYLDARVVKIRDGCAVRRKACDIVMGVNTWVQTWIVQI